MELLNGREVIRIIEAWILELLSAEVLKAVDRGEYLLLLNEGRVP